MSELRELLAERCRVDACMSKNDPFLEMLVDEHEKMIEYVATLQDKLLETMNNVDTLVSMHKKREQVQQGEKKRLEALEDRVLKYGKRVQKLEKD